MKVLLCVILLSIALVLSKCEMESVDVPGEHSIEIVPAKREITYDLEGNRFYREIRGNFIGEWQEYKKAEEPEFDLADDEYYEEMLMQEKRGRKRNNGNTDYSSADVEKILKRHNYLRARVSPHASNMEQMSWNAKLATLAQAWSDGCLYAHPSESNPKFKDVGQNLHITWQSSSDNPPDVVHPTQEWYDEVVDYHLSSLSCNPEKKCGHYTQLVWAHSSKVGCGLTFCPMARDNNGTTYINAWLVVCNYSPAGNYVGKPPYSTGEECSNCPNRTCQNGLCTKCSVGKKGCECLIDCKNGGRKMGKCKCSCPDGYYGTTCEKECVDNHPYCGASPGWFDDTQCSFATYVPELCPKMCHVC